MRLLRRLRLLAMTAEKGSNPHCFSIFSCVAYIPFLTGGERGIRTLGTSFRTYIRLAGERLRPTRPSLRRELIKLVNNITLWKFLFKRKHNKGLFDGQFNYFHKVRGTGFSKRNSACQYNVIETFMPRDSQPCAN